MSLKPVLDALIKIAEVPSRNKKKTLIKKFNDLPFFKEAVTYAYDSRKTYNINKFPDKALKTIHKSDDLKIFEMLDSLALKRGAKNSEIDLLHSLCEDNATCELVGRILNKDLRCGVNIKTWKEFYSLFEHNPMLCKYAVRYTHSNGEYSSDLDVFVQSCGGWENIIGSTKANGVRVWVNTYGEKPEYISRNGKPYLNFHVLNKDCLTIAKRLQVAYDLPTMPTLDGEVIVLGEDFQDQMTQVRRIKDVDPSKFRFVLFDCPDLPLSQAERSNTLDNLLEELGDNHEISKTTFVEEVMFDDFEDFHTWFLTVVVDRNLEGLVLKKADAPYEFSRSPYWCKVKDWFSADVRVIGAEEGCGKFEGKLGALIVDFKGVQVRVGTGFSDEQRENYSRNGIPEVVEIEYKTITKDGSLQHPSFVKEREDLIGLI